jgi:hypothetical protein
MPIAQKFKALGAGNGFGGCLGKVDVSVYDNWVALTLKQAMNLYWNLSSANADFQSRSSGSSSASSLAPASSYSLTKNLLSTKFSVTPEPKERVRSGTTVSPTSATAGIEDHEIGDYYQVGSAGGIARFHNVGIVRMYDGSTNDESNFVGYGTTLLYSMNAGASVGESVLTSSISIRVASFLDGEDEDSSDDQDGSGVNTIHKKTASQVTLGGMPFRSHTTALMSGPTDLLSPNILASAGSVSASDSISWTSEFTINEVTETITSTASASNSASVPSLDFYIYSA